MAHGCSCPGPEVKRQAWHCLSPFPSPGSAMGIRVLLIEDEDQIADFVVRGLREEGFTVERAADGEEAWQLAQRAASHPGVDERVTVVQRSILSLSVVGPHIGSIPSS